MSKWNLIVDVAECTNCNLCALATQDEYSGNDWPGVAAEMPRHGHRWIDIKRKERGQAPLVDVAYLPVMCQHCDDAPCMKVAKDGAVTKRADGIVIIDPVKAKGQKQIVEACPFDAVFWNEEKQLPQAWPFDAHLLDAGWKEPRAATACPTGAIRALKVEDAEMDAIRARDGLEQLKPEAGVRPRVWYRNLYRYSKCMVAGTVAATIAGQEECVEGAAVTLKRDGATVGTATTDAFGDFRIDRIEPDSGKYALTVEKDGFPSRTLDVTVTDSVTIGTITL
ncbi:MAG: 4Fe-4S dicluster domain-containing protein [Alphaproteobacteria bacterium]